MFVGIDSNLSKIEADEQGGPFETAACRHRVVLRLLSTGGTVEMSLVPHFSLGTFTCRQDVDGLEKQQEKMVNCVRYLYDVPMTTDFIGVQE